MSGKKPSSCHAGSGPRRHNSCRWRPTAGPSHWAPTLAGSSRGAPRRSLCCVVRPILRTVGEHSCPHVRSERAVRAVGSGALRQPVRGFRSTPAARFCSIRTRVAIVRVFSGRVRRAGGEKGEGRSNRGYSDPQVPLSLTKPLDPLLRILPRGVDRHHSERGKRDALYNRDLYAGLVCRPAWLDRRRLPYLKAGNSHNS